MARKKHAKHSKNTVLASSSARHPFSKLSASAATAVVGASLALSVTPALAKETAPAKTPESTVVATEKKPETPKAPVTTPKTPENNTQGGGTQKLSSKAEDRASNNDAKPSQIKPDTTDTKNTKINVDENNAGTMPNAYSWGSSDNTFSEDGAKHTVTFHFAVPKTGGKITNIAIFPAQNNGLNNDKSKKGAEYYSGDPKMRQSFSGNYTFKQNDDGSVDLTMSDLFSKGTVNGGAEKYVANRSIFVYVTKDGKEAVAYKTNAFRAATLVTPKSSGSVVLKYDQPLTKEQIQAAITAAANAETTRSDKKSVNDQIVAASQAKGVFTTVDGSSKQVPDTLNDKLNVKSDDAYDKPTFDAINKETSAKDAKNKTYVAGAKTLNTYMVTDLGFKSQAIPLTVARYDDRIDKPIVEDPTNVSTEVKEDIKKKLAKINGVTPDKITFDGDDNAVIHFDGVDEKDAPKIALRNLVLKQLTEDKIKVPAESTATVIYNPLAYSDAEINSIKQSILDANKDNKELGLTSVDQISLEYLKGNFTKAGQANQGISNGQAENKITVKIKTDKAVAEFKSDVTKGKLTRLVDIRKDYKVEWTKAKLDNRDNDEGFSWSDDKHTTIIYRYDPAKGTAFKTNEIIKLLKATPNDKNAGLRDLTGGEKLDYEGSGKPQQSHMHFALKDDQPTGELTLGIMNGPYWKGDPQVANSDANLGNEESTVGSYSWDDEAGSVTVAAKQNKVFKARLFVEPYEMSYYLSVYTHPDGKSPNNTPKAINVIFVPQTNHKTGDLKASIGEHATTQVEGKDIPTDSKYYNASADKKKAYEDALSKAKTLYESVKDTDEAKLTEKQKADIDNATIKLNKARAELDGPKTDKEKLKASIGENGKAQEGQTAGVVGTVTTDKYKNVAKPSFLNDDGTPDTKKNEAASAAKTAYDEALAAAEKVNKDDNATQKDVDAAKAKLDAARKELDKYSTNKDKLNAAIAEHGQVKNGKNDQGTQDVTKADPTYQNSEEKERKAYDEAVKKANDLSKDPNASQKDVNDAITALEKAKKALDDKATNKAKLAAAIQQTFDNPDPADESKRSTFYKNALGKKNSTDPNVTQEQKNAAEKAINDYDQALAEAKKLLEDKDGKATQAQVDAAVQALTDAEDKLHNYSTDNNDLTKALADNIDGYLKPAYFNAFDKSLGTGADAEAAKKAFREYNDAYHKAKELKEKFASADASKQPTDDECKKAKEALEQARHVIDTYATDTSKLSAAFWNDLAIQNSPAYKNAKALADKQNPAEDEKAQVEAAKKIKQAYDDAVAKLHKAFSNTLDQDKDAQGTPFAKIPDATGDPTSKNYLDGVQAHANGEPLDRDVTDILKAMNDAADQLKQFATKTDKLQESIDKDADTQKDPAYKNTTNPSYKKTNDPTADDTEKNGKASAAKTAYDNALKAAKALMVKPDATQKEINDAKTALDNARKALDDYKTDVSKLQESADKHGKDAKGSDPAVEGTKDSDAYRNASDPHFVDENGTPDEVKNQQARDAKTAYDKALAEAQSLLAKHNDDKTPQDAKPTQAEIDAALAKLDEARKTLVGDDSALDKPGFGTKTTDLDVEIVKSSAADATTPTPGTVEDTTAYKNALAKTTEDGKENPDITRYKEALKKARELAEKQKSTKASERPLQKDVDEAYRALLDAKKIIADGYKTNATALQDEAALGAVDGNFTKSPEYKNAEAKKADDGTDNDELKAYKAALTEVTTMLNNFGKDGKPSAGVDDKDLPTQAQVNAALEKLSNARKAVEAKYKTNTDALKNEVGDKDAQGNPVTPPFEASVAYKNALEKKNAGDTDATSKLEAYNEKLKAAQKLIDQVNNPDQNADTDKKPTQAQVDQALQDLKNAKKALVDAFQTNASALKKEAKELKDNGQAKDDKDKFENSPQFKNADAKKAADGTSDNEDVAAYKAALKKANELLELFGEDGKPKAQLPAGKQVPSQQEVDEALKNLKEIKDKITKNYVTSPKDLQDEVDISVSGPTATGEPAFEDTGAYHRALNDKVYDDKGQLVDNAKVARYKKALAAAKAMLAKFDRATGKPKADATDVPTQQQLDAALAELKAAKKAITEIYTWMNYFPWDSWSTMIPQPEQKPGEPAPAPAPTPAPAVSEPEDSLAAPASEGPARVAPAHAPKHLAQTSDPTSGFALATMLGSAFGFIVAGLKRKRNRR